MIAGKKNIWNFKLVMATLLLDFTDITLALRIWQGQGGGWIPPCETSLFYYAILYFRLHSGRKSKNWNFFVFI